MTKLSYAAALVGALGAVSALPAPLASDWTSDSNVTDSSELTKRTLIGDLPENAHRVELMYQPYMDFDRDSCYQTSAIDYKGNLNPGIIALGGVVSEGCRDPSRLENSNTYARRRCNNNVCGIVYAYYYEKDADSDLGIFGHRHDWEHVVVFTGPGDQLLGAAASTHSTYIKKKKGEFPTSKDGKRPIIVYHKQGASTHGHRFANNNDIQHYENYTGNSFRAKLVGWLGWPAGLRQKVLDKDWGDAQIALQDKDNIFAQNLEKAGARDYGLDPYGPDNQPH